MENIKHPKAKDVLKVIRNFEKLPEHVRNEENNVDMGISPVKGAFEKCGTILCHGGWYTVASCILLPFISASYERGADKMARHLGFKDMIGLQRWANKNPEIWGNRYGGDMFCSKSAFFGKRTLSEEDTKFSLQTIINHWKGVYQRLYDLENPKPIVNEVYPDITKDLANLPTEEKPDIIVKVKEEAIF